MLGPRYEAGTWLAANANPHALASNRFESTAAALAFVDTLYALGADTVFVTNVQGDSSWIRAQGGPYADALWIRVPADPDPRRALFAIAAREAEREGAPPETDRGQTLLYLWWD